MGDHQPYGPQGSRDERYVSSARSQFLRGAIRDRLSLPDPGSATAGTSAPPAPSYTGDQGYNFSPYGVSEAADEEEFLDSNEGEHPLDDDEAHEGEHPPIAPTAGDPGYVDTGFTPQRSGVWRYVRRQLEVKVCSYYGQDIIPTPGGYGEQMIGAAQTVGFQLQPALGFDVNQRVGNRIMLRRMHVRGVFWPQIERPGGTLNGDVECRFVVGMNLSPMLHGSVSAIRTQDIFDTTAGANGQLEDYAVWNKQRFKPLRDERWRGVFPSYTITGIGDRENIGLPFEMDIDVNTLIDFDSSGHAVNCSPFVWYAMTDSSGFLDFKAYFYFTDC